MSETTKKPELPKVGDAVWVRLIVTDVDPDDREFPIKVEFMSRWVKPGDFRTDPPPAGDGEVGRVEA